MYFGAMTRMVTSIEFIKVMYLCREKQERDKT